jgi:hypothetical protein
MLNREERWLVGRIAWLLVRLALALPAAALPQTDPSRKADSVIGEVTARDLPARRLTLKPDAGGSVEVTVQERATILRTKPGAPTLADATPVPLEEIVVGDRVLARGTLSDDKGSLAARQLVVMTRDDIARKQEAERAEWRRRGVLGVVTAVDADKGEITLRVGRLAVAQPLVVETADRKVAFRRYAPDSVKFSDTRPSALGEVRVGDQLRALGDRGPDGSRLAAEQVVFGTFRTVSGTVTAVDRGRKEVTMRAEESRRTLTVTVGPDARVRRLPPEMGARLARAEGGPREPGGGAEDLLERMPATTLTELKAGDRILVASTEGSDPARLNAIALVAGLEALRPAAASGRAARGPDVGLPGDLLDLGMGSLP